MATVSKAEDFLGKEVFVKIDRPLGSIHPKHKHIVYSINYGFIPGTLSPDAEELDAYIIGVAEELETFSGVCIAFIRRKNDHDDKLIVAPNGLLFTEEEIRNATSFQEQYFESEIIFNK